MEGKCEYVLHQWSGWIDRCSGHHLLLSLGFQGHAYRPHKGQLTWFYTTCVYFPAYVPDKYISCILMFKNKGNA